MKRMYFSTIVRGMSTDRLEKARIYILDYDTKQVSYADVPVADHTVDGKSRGARGLEFYQDHIWLATTNRELIKLHPDTLEIVKSFPLSEMTGDLHQIRARDGMLKITSCDTNSILYFDGEKVVDIESLKKVEPFIKDRIDPINENHPWSTDVLHLNSLDWSPNGDEYHIYAACHCLYNYTKDRVVVGASKKVIKSSGVETPNQPHDVRIYNDEIAFINSSGTNETLKVDLIRGTFKSIHREPEIPNYNNSWNKSGWARGMSIHGDKLFVAYTPCMLRVFNVLTCELLESIQVSEDPHETTFDILLDPRDWS